jgi:hypothetical protein
MGFQLMMHGQDAHASMPLREPDSLLKVPESMVDDLEAIQKAMTLIRKATRYPNDTVAIAKTSQTLNNELAKTIFSKISRKKGQGQNNK